MMMTYQNTKTDFSTTDVFKWNVNIKDRYVVNQGGTSSGKTYAILQVLLFKAAQNQNSVITIVGQDFPNLRKGALRDFDNIVQQYPFSTWIGKPNKSTMVYPLFNGSVIEFATYGDEQDAKSGKRDYLFINEADGVSYPIFRQLAMRTGKQIFIDFNPSREFWAHTYLKGKKDCVFIYSTWRDNQYCPIEIVRDIEALKETSPELYKVYSLGRAGNLTGQVFPDVNIVPEFPKEAKNITYGLDFGYSNSRTALSKVGEFNGELYLQELIYERGLFNKDIAGKLKGLGLNHYSTIIADSAEPKTIAELNTLGFNVKGTTKGPDVKRAGIWKIKQFKINLTSDSINARKEKKNYIWKVNKDGEPLNEPIKAFDDFWDATRYAVQYMYLNDAKTLPKML